MTLPAKRKEGDSVNSALRRTRRLATAAVAAAAVAFAATGSVQAQPGTSLGVVTLPGNGGCSVAGSFDGTYYITTAPTAAVVM